MPKKRKINVSPKPAVTAKAATKPAAVTAAPAVPAKAEKPKRELHDTVTRTYAGVSPTIRSGYTGPVCLEKPASTVRERDEAHIRDLRNAYGGKPFKRLNTDAGSNGRAITLGLMRYVSGGTRVTCANGSPGIAGADAIFQLTERALASK